MWFFGRPLKPKCELDFEAAHCRFQEEIVHELRGYLMPSLLEWSRLHTKVEYILDAIPQRQRRLQQLKSKIQCDASEAGQKLKLSPQEWQDRECAESKIDEELTVLRREYNGCVRGLDSMDRSSPPCAVIQDCILLRESRDRYGLTYAWLHGRTKCAKLGGCCGRTCGCCEIPLRTYLQPKDEGSRDGGNEVIEVRGHCTLECACCIRHYGYYKPAVELPGTAFMPDF